jgi:hypothetical protein
MHFAAAVQAVRKPPVHVPARCVVKAVARLTSDSENREEARVQPVSQLKFVDKIRRYWITYL